MILTSEMAAWTQADADQVRAAVVALAAGTRVVKVIYAGPPSREVDYATADLPQLRSLLSEIERSLAGASPYRRVAFNKGFDPSRSS